MLYLSLILIITSFGSISLHRAKNKDALIEYKNPILINLITLTPLILSFFIISELWGLKWYWNLILTFGLNFILQDLLASLYSSFLGYKTKPQLSLLKGGYVRHNIHFIDAVITFVIGAFIFFISK